MSKVVLTVGVSGSGKTTWARQFVAENANAVVISRDDIRLMLGQPPVGTPEQEKRVTKLQRGMIETALLDGFSPVIVADTNLNKDLRKNLVSYIHKLGHDVEFKIFDVDLQTCIDRDAARQKPVGEIIIRRQWNKFSSYKANGFADFEDAPVERYADYSHGDDRTDVIVVDIDGTVAEGKTVRSMYDYTKVLLDLPRQDVIDVIKALSTTMRVIFVSGREDSCRVDTEQWLREYVGVDFTLYMRETGDERPDYIIKNEIYDEHLIPFYNIKMVFDDRNQVVSHLRARGISVAQVAPGRF